ncbi:unnamed protein product, partial [Pipistrellus nathusii]
MEEDTSSTKVNWKSVYPLNDKEKKKVTKIMTLVNSVLKKNKDQKGKGRKRRINVFHCRMGRKPPVSEPTNEQEEVP